MRYLILIFGIIVNTNLYAQSSHLQSQSFPESWAGIWRGELELFGPKGKIRSVNMETHIIKSDTSTDGRYLFGTVYGTKDADWRPYELVPVDTAKGLWILDEKNSIKIETYLIGPKLVCWYVVEDTRILCTYEITAPNTLVFEVLAGREMPVSLTGKTRQGNEDIPEVKTFPVTGFQRAVLKRTN